MYSFRFSLLLLSAATLLSACSPSLPTVRELAQYQPVPIAGDAVDGSVVTKKPRVVIVESREGGDTVRRADLSSALVGAISSLLTKSGNIEIVDPNLAKALADELRKIELSGGNTTAYSGPAVANWGIKPVVTFANYKTTTEPARSEKDKNGKVKYFPAVHTLSGEAKAIIYLYEIPSMRQVKAIQLSKSGSETVQSSVADERQGFSLLKKITSEMFSGFFGSIPTEAKDLLNSFSPRGQVVERRVFAKEKHSLFLITTGSGDGLKPNDEVRFFRMVPGAVIPGRPGREMEYPVTKGRVSKIIDEDSAWIFVSDEDAAKRVRRGDLVKKVH